MEETLGKLEVFSVLSGEELSRIEAVGEKVTVGAGEHIIEEGGTLESLYVILDGRVKVSKGEKLSLFLREGSLIGELAFIDRKATSADVWAESDTKLLKIPFTSLEALFAEDRDLACRLQGALLKTLARKIRDTNEWLVARGLTPGGGKRDRVVYL